MELYSKTIMKNEQTRENIFMHMWNLTHFSQVNLALSVVNLGTFQGKFLEREFPRKKPHKNQYIGKVGGQKVWKQVCL